MLKYVLNCRQEQLDPSGRVITLPRHSLKQALEAAGHRTLLYASTRENHHGYFAVATLGNPTPYPELASHCLPLLAQDPLRRRVTADELSTVGIGEDPFYTYRRPIREVPGAYLQYLLTSDVLPAGMSEPSPPQYAGWPSYRYVESVSSRQFRFEVLDAHGLTCAVTNKRYGLVKGSLNSTDVGHIWPRWAGGPDVFENAIPMLKDINFLWDHGIISMTQFHRMIVSTSATDDVKALVIHGAQIRLPRDARFWPKAEHLERHRDEIFEKSPMPKWSVND